MADHEHIAREELYRIVEDRLERDGIPVTERFNPEPPEGSRTSAEAGSDSTQEPGQSDGVSTSDAPDGAEDGQSSE